MKPAGFNRRVAEKAESYEIFPRRLGASAVDFVFFAGLLVDAVESSGDTIALPVMLIKPKGRLHSCSFDYDMIILRRSLVKDLFKPIS
jgi:hypothetical protein